jgi:hypothetical protein
MHATNTDNGQNTTATQCEYAQPKMPPPPYLKMHFINTNSFKAAINTKLDKPMVSLFRLSIRLLQFAFALASGISYAVDLSHGETSHPSTFIYVQVLFGLTLVTLDGQHNHPILPIHLDSGMDIGRIMVCLFRYLL